MRTSELAGRAGVNAETLRYYERRPLLDVPPRTPGGNGNQDSSGQVVLEGTTHPEE
jgi:DNA-binding transcriptional MerR regulator